MDVTADGTADVTADVTEAAGIARYGGDMDVSEWTPERFEVIIAAALRDRDDFAAGRLTGELAKVDPVWAGVVREAAHLGESLRRNRATLDDAAAQSFTERAGWSVDFDGVLHDYWDGWRDGSIYGGVKPGALVALWAMQQDAPVHVCTARPDLWQVAAWLHGRGVPVVLDYQDPEYTPGAVDDPGPPGWGVRARFPVLDAPARFWIDADRVLVTGRKLPAKVYIDDRAYQVTDWRDGIVGVHDLAVGQFRDQGMRERAQ